MTSSNNKIRVFIADDHFVVRQGLNHIISQNTDMEVMGEAEDGNQVLDRLKDLVVDVILLDIEMPKKWLGSDAPIKISTPTSKNSNVKYLFRGTLWFTVDQGWCFRILDKIQRSRSVVPSHSYFGGGC